MERLCFFERCSRRASRCPKRRLPGQDGYRGHPKMGKQMGEDHCLPTTTRRFLGSMWLHQRDRIYGDIQGVN